MVDNIGVGMRGWIAANIIYIFTLPVLIDQYPVVDGGWIENNVLITKWILHTLRIG
jgi:hypothetical protein